MGRSISWNCISGGGGATLCRSGIQVNQTIIRRTFGVNSNPYTSRLALPLLSASVDPSTSLASVLLALSAVPVKRNSIF